MGGIFRSASGGAVGGKSSLTTAGSIAYVASAGVLAQDTSFARSAAGRYTLYDATPTTGVTTFDVRAGAGQSATALQRWLNSAGSSLATIRSDGSGDFVSLYLGGFQQATAAGGSMVTNAAFYVTGIARLTSGGQFCWTDNSGAPHVGNQDTGLARDAAGRVRVTNGSTGLGQIMIASSTPASASATGAAGTLTWDSTYLYICTAANTWRRVAHATW